jgi:phenylacetic acid degradation protein
MAQVFEIDGIIPVVDPASFVHPTAVLIGDVIIGPNCYVGPGASLRGDFGRIVMERGSNLQDNCVVHGFPQSDSVIAEDGHIGHGAVLHCCVVGRNAMVGMNAVINDGAVIGESAVVAAMAFVRAGFEVPARTMAVGIPAQVRRELTEQELEWKRIATLEYQDLTRRCLESFKPAKALDAPEPDRGRVYEGAFEPLHLTKSR